MDYENKLLKNTFFDLLVISTNNSHYIEKTNEFRYFSFDLIYSRLKQNEHLLIDDWENEIILYISKNLEIYRQLTDDKMKIVSLVSMLELLIAHNPNSSRYNVEDSIRRQFSNKIMIILYLNSLVKEPDNLEKLLLFIYDLRSCIAHGNFNEISSSCKKIYQWLLNNDKNFTTNNSKFDEKSVLDYINLLLRKYFRVVLRHYLSDKKLFKILKK